MPAVFAGVVVSVEDAAPGGSGHMSFIAPGHTFLLSLWLSRELHPAFLGCPSVNGGGNLFSATALCHARLPLVSGHEKKTRHELTGLSPSIVVMVRIFSQALCAVACRGSCVLLLLLHLVRRHWFRRA